MRGERRSNTDPENFSSDDSPSCEPFSCVYPCQTLPFFVAKKYCSRIPTGRGSLNLQLPQGTSSPQRTTNITAAIAPSRAFTEMASWWRWLWCSTFLILSAPIPTASDLFKTFRPGETQPLESQECPRSCTDVFRKLEWRRNGYGGGGHYQKLHVQERGGMICCARKCAVCGVEHMPAFSTTYPMVNARQQAAKRTRTCCQVTAQARQ